MRSSLVKETLLSSLREFNSDNADRLTVAQIKNKLLSLEFVRNELNNLGLLEAAVSEDRA